MASPQNGAPGGGAAAPLEKRGDLERGLGLKEAVALNMIEMVGVGPFVVIPLVIKAMGGPQCLLAWAAGAVLALLDGFVWSELGAAMPLAGGSYVFLREAYGPGRMGRMMSFLFVWQTLIQAPLSARVGRHRIFAVRFLSSPPRKIRREGALRGAGDRPSAFVISTHQLDWKNLAVSVGRCDRNDLVADLGRCNPLPA